MKGSTEPTDAHVILFAVQAASEGDLDTLLKLIQRHRDVLSDNLAYRLLLSFYPTETSDTAPVVTFLKSLGQASDRIVAVNLDPAISSLSASQALHRCRGLSLHAIPEHTSIHTQSQLANVVIEWAKQLEELDGTTQPAAAFVEEFIDQDPDLRLWYETYLVPLLRLQYEFYPDADDMINLDSIEHLSPTGGVETLLQYAERQHSPSDVARDLEQVVSPWMHGANKAKRRRLQTQPDDKADHKIWDPVYEWLASSSRTDFNVAAKAFVQWNGPVEVSKSTDEVARFAQTGLAIIYECPDVSTKSLDTCGQVLGKSASILGLDLPDLLQLDQDFLVAEDLTKELDETKLLPNSLRQSSNQLTQGKETSVQLMSGLLVTARVLSGHGLSWTLRDLARNCIFGSERRHKDELRRLLQHIQTQTRKEIDWQSVRQQMLWLQSWAKDGHQNQSTSRQPAFLSRLTRNYVETQLLDALLKAGQYNGVKDVYFSTSSSPLSFSEVEVRVVAAIYEAYDNASNGNRDRGGMRRANEILKAFRPKFPQSLTLSDLEYLIKATHSLSFYQLILQHGVPFKPVAIRVQKDPLTLLEKALEQDARAYTKLDDLLEIGRNLVRAHLPARGAIAEDAEPLEVRILNAEHRLTYAAIMAALATNDFNTAYAYITTRLHTSPEQTLTSEITDDTSWRAAYAAGRYRPSTSPKTLTARIDSLAQRMELLSRALMLAPSGEALSGILATWRRYEEELDALRTQAVQEERAFDARADASLPGAFDMEDRDADAAETKSAMARRAGPAGLTPSYEEEAPLGLFDVARGAASALGKSAAFPLGSTGLRDLKISSGTANAPGTDREQASSPTSDDGRVRKRDMVANMVGSGLGWFLGAQAQDRSNYRSES